MMTKQKLIDHLAANGYARNDNFFSQANGCCFELFDDTFDLTIESQVIPGSNQWFSIVKTFKYTDCELEQGTLHFGRAISTEVIELF